MIFLKSQMNLSNILYISTLHAFLNFILLLYIKISYFLFSFFELNLRKNLGILNSYMKRKKINTEL